MKQIKRNMKQIMQKYETIQIEGGGNRISEDNTSSRNMKQIRINMKQIKQKYETIQIETRERKIVFPRIIH